MTIPLAICEEHDIQYGDFIVIKEFHVVKESGEIIKSIRYNTLRGTRSQVMKRCFDLFVPTVVKKAVLRMLREQEAKKDVKSD